MTERVRQYGSHQWPEIFLEPECDCNGYEGRLWCHDDQGPCEECRRPWVRYVLAPVERDDLIAGVGDEGIEVEGEPR